MTPRTHLSVMIALALVATVLTGCPDDKGKSATPTASASAATKQSPPPASSEKAGTGGGGW
jgi:hypothetical protein